MQSEQVEQERSIEVDAGVKVQGNSARCTGRTLLKKGYKWSYKIFCGIQASIEQQSESSSSLQASESCVCKLNRSFQRASGCFSIPLKISQLQLRTNPIESQITMISFLNAQINHKFPIAMINSHTRFLSANYYNRSLFSSWEGAPVEPGISSEGELVIDDWSFDLEYEQLMECKSRVGWDHVHVLRQVSSSSSSSAFQEARRGIIIVVDRRERIKLLVSSCCCFYSNIIVAHCAPGSTRNLPPRCCGCHVATHVLYIALMHMGFLYASCVSVHRGKSRKFRCHFLFYYYLCKKKFNCFYQSSNAPFSQDT